MVNVRRWSFCFLLFLKSAVSFVLVGAFLAGLDLQALSTPLSLPGVLESVRLCLRIDSLGIRSLAFPSWDVPTPFSVHRLGLHSLVFFGQNNVEVFHMYPPRIVCTTTSGSMPWKRECTCIIVRLPSAPSESPCSCARSAGLQVVVSCSFQA